MVSTVTDSWPVGSFKNTMECSEDLKLEKGDIIHKAAASLVSLSSVVVVVVVLVGGGGGGGVTLLLLLRPEVTVCG